MAKLIIKYQDDYIVERDKNKYKLIDVPTYYHEEDFPNISIFVILLCGADFIRNPAVFFQIYHSAYVQTIIIRVKEWKFTFFYLILVV